MSIVDELPGIWAYDWQLPKIVPTNPGIIKWPIFKLIKSSIGKSAARRTRSTFFCYRRIMET